MNKTIGVLFISTPHLGISIGPSYSFLLDYIGSDDIKSLKLGNEHIRELRETFSQVAKRIPIVYSILETDKTPIYGQRKRMIVPPESAVIEVGQIYHVDVCTYLKLAANIFYNLDTSLQCL
jgi:exo-beta-1,3-glucanase (GH17 family)